jgi:hypothetical protein
MREVMTSILARTLVLAGLIALPAIPALAQSSKPTSAKIANAQCMLDDGYGRLRSCSQGYKRNNPNWRASDSCYTDDGYGRYRSCSAGSVGFKRKAKS